MTNPPLFTLKHYAKIIRVMRVTRPQVPHAMEQHYRYWQWDNMVNLLAQEFARDNPKHFKRDLFIQACNEQVTEPSK